MLSPEEIAEQQQLLVTHRRTLAIYLKQQAMLGRAYSPPALINGIEEARNNIRRIKRRLNAAGVVIPDDPDDDSFTSPLVPPVTLPAQRQSRRLWVWLGVAGILALVLVIGVGWWFSSPPSHTPSQKETPSPRISSAPTAGSTNATVTSPTVSELEQQLADVNIVLSAGTTEYITRVRGWLKDTEEYRSLATSCLSVLGGQRLRKPLQLDTLAGYYRYLVNGNENIPANTHDDLSKLREAMLKHWNDTYGEQVTSLDQIVEPNP